jgi:hypothetical protein
MVTGTVEWLDGLEVELDVFELVQARNVKARRTARETAAKY